MGKLTFELIQEHFIRCVEEKSMRLVVEDHHDYCFKFKGKTVATITKKCCVCRIGDVVLEAYGDEAKALWVATKTAFGHTLEGLAQ